MENVLSREFGWSQVGGTSGSTLDGTSATVLHIYGDPVNENQMRACLGTTLFCTAIVLGSTPEEDSLKADLRDTRVLQVMLILRKVTEELGQTMHVIGENWIDQTSNLALGPHATPNSASDFINIQAIIARTLVMNLAYPQVNLFSFFFFHN